MFGRVLGQGFNDKGKEEQGAAVDVQKDFRLNIFQLAALHNVHAQKAGITKEHLRGCEWFNSDIHIRALNLILQNRPRTPIDELLDHLKQDTPLQLEAMLQGFNEDDVRQLNQVQLNVLMTFGQPHIAKQLAFHEGFDLVKYLQEREWMCDEQFPEVLEKMVLHFGCSFEESIASLEQFSYYQLYVLKNCMSYGVVAADLKEFDWLDRPERALALTTLLKVKDKDDAFKICTAATQEWQLKAIQKSVNGYGAEEAVQLQHEQQYKAWSSLVHYGVTVELLREQDWLTSKYHVLILKHQLQGKCQVIHRKTEQQKAAIILEFNANANSPDLTEDEVLCERIEACEHADKEARELAAATSVRNIAGSNETEAKIMYRLKLGSLSMLKNLNEFQKQALVDILQPQLMLHDVRTQPWLNSAKRLSFFKLLLKDTRLVCLRFKPENFGKMTAELSSWSDHDFKQAIASAERTPIKKDGCYTYVPALTAILESAHQRQHQLNKCVVM